MLPYRKHFSHTYLQRWLIYLALLHVCLCTKLSSPSPSPPVTPARLERLPAHMYTHTQTHTLDCLCCSIFTSSLFLSCYHCVPTPSFSLSALSYQEFNSTSLLLSSAHHTSLSAVWTLRVLYDVFHIHCVVYILLLEPLTVAKFPSKCRANLNRIFIQSAKEQANLCVFPSTILLGEY